MTVPQASRLRNVRYDIRGRCCAGLSELEAAGHQILKLNLGNPAPFGLHAPDAMLRRRGAEHRRRPGLQRRPGHPRRPGWRWPSTIERHGVAGVTPDDVFLGNGVSELIVMALQALLDTGDEVLVPSPDYPLWTGAVNLCGGRAVHYRCDEQQDWAPDLEHVAAQITEHTRALVIINPNNPTGAVYSRETLLGLLDLARRHGLLVLTDEIYDQILYDGRRAPECAAALAPDLLVLTLGGLSKTYRLAGLPVRLAGRSPGRTHEAADYLEGLELLANMRLCPNVPAQYADPDRAGRLAEHHRAAAARAAGCASSATTPGSKITEIPGVDCVKPAGALYLFPRLDPDVHKITRRPADGHRPAGAAAHAAVPRHRLQPAHDRPPAAGVPGPGGRARRRHRPAGHVPEQLPPVAAGFRGPRVSRPGHARGLRRERTGNCRIAFR